LKSKLLFPSRLEYICNSKNKLAGDEIEQARGGASLENNHCTRSRRKLD
jgi:hypothetical protein